MSMSSVPWTTSPGFSVMKMFPLDNQEKYTFLHLIVKRSTRCCPVGTQSVPQEELAKRGPLRAYREPVSLAPNDDKKYSPGKEQRSHRAIRFSAVPAGIPIMSG